MSLFHYTDVNAVQSILLHKKLWLTDIRYLNDSQELHDGVGFLRQALEEPMPTFSMNIKYINEALNYLRSSFEDSVSFGVEEEPVFVFSLGRVGNLLSQWRAYGSYAIEFDEDLLLEYVPSLTGCIYEDGIKIDKSNSAISDAFVDISNDMGKNNGCIGIESLDALSNLVSLAATFKNKGFSEEEEVRIVAKAEECDNKILYTQRGNKLIPRLELDIELDCIKTIHVGPMNEQELAFKSMSSFVRKIEMDWQHESSNIEYELSVEKSSIPYRPI